MLSELNAVKLLSELHPFMLEFGTLSWSLFNAFCMEFYKILCYKNTIIVIVEEKKSNLS